MPDVFGVPASAGSGSLGTLKRAQQTFGVPASAGLCRYHTLKREHPTFPTHPLASPG